MYIYLYIHVYIHIYIYIHIYEIIKIMCSPGYHHNGPVATHALGYMMYGFTNNIGVPKRRKYVNHFSKQTITASLY